MSNSWLLVLLSLSASRSFSFVFLFDVLFSSTHICAQTCLAGCKYDSNLLSISYLSCSWRSLLFYPPPPQSSPSLSLMYFPNSVLHKHEIPCVSLSALGYVLHVMSDVDHSKIEPLGHLQTVLCVNFLLCIYQCVCF